MKDSKEKITPELLEEAKKGDKKSIEKVISLYKGFVYVKAKDFFINGAEKDDVLQEAMVGLFKAIKGYDEDKFASFNAFAALCIQRQIITAVKVANSPKNLSSSKAVEAGDFDIIGESSNPQGFSSYFYDNPEEICITKAEMESLSSFLKKHLSEFEQEVFGYLVSGYEYKEMADLLKKDTKAIDNSIQRIRRKSIQWLKGRE